MFYSLSFGQDSYPYFQDIKKQFEFDKKRIIIKEANEREMYVSGGGDKFNWWSILDQSEPMYLSQPVTTDYINRYNFEITLNGKQIDEIAFLHIVGLEEEAERLYDDYKNKLSKWKKNSTYEREITHPMAETVSNGLFIFGGLMFFAFATLEPPNDSGPDNRPWIGAASIGAAILVEDITIKEKFKRNDAPTFNSTLSTEQIKSLSESYNRRLYNEIKQR